MPDNKYCYPNSNILRNKLQIQDKDKLLQAEIHMTGNRMIELQNNSVSGKFDFQHLCDIRLGGRNKNRQHRKEQFVLSRTAHTELCGIYF